MKQFSIGINSHLCTSCAEGTDEFLRTLEMFSVRHHHFPLPAPFPVRKGESFNEEVENEQFWERVVESVSFRTSLGVYL